MKYTFPSKQFMPKRLTHKIKSKNSSLNFNDLKSIKTHNIDSTIRHKSLLRKLNPPKQQKSEEHLINVTSVCVCG